MGKLTTSAAVNLNVAGATYRVQLVSTTAGVTYDQLSSTGTVNITGAMLAGSISAPVTAGGTYTIITATAVTGTFAGLANNAMLYIGGEKFQIQYTATAVNLVHQNISVSTSTVDVNNKLGKHDS